MHVGDITLTRVGYFDVALDPAVANMTAAEITSLPWAVPAWAQADGNVLIGQALWVIEAGERVLVVDPCGAADDFLRTGEAAVLHQERVAEIMRDAGVPVERVDTVVLTHLDGIGMTAAVDADAAGGWVPMFPNARVVLTRLELEYLASATGVLGLDAFHVLLAAGVVDGVDRQYELAPGVVLEHTGGHSPGHTIVRIGRGAESVVLLGHLAVSPVQLAADQPPTAHLDAARANAVTRELLREARADGARVAGSLWPAPGIATIGAAGEIVPLTVRGRIVENRGATAGSFAILEAMDHATTEQLEAGLDEIRRSPRDNGTLELIVCRPEVGERRLLTEGELDLAVGLVGDSWCRRPSRETADGAPHPDAQLNVMNARAAALVARNPDRRALAGDQLYLDFDLSAANVPPGSQLEIGTAVIEITAKPHTGCTKFRARFGADAMRFVNSEAGRELKLRGVNAKVVQPGRVRVGDTVRKRPD